MAREKTDIIEKVKKLMALAGNNSSAEEAESAALKAQELIAKHDISAEDLEATAEEKETIEYTVVNVGTGKAWKFQLANIIAQNFRCKHFWYGRSIVAFYGYKTDTQVAAEVFNFVFKAGHKLADREVHARYNRGLRIDGTYNSFTMGFMRGLKEKLDAQCVALMIVTSPEVISSYTDFSKSFKHLKNTGARFVTSRFDNDAYNNGVYEGRNVMGKREIKAHV